MADSKKEKFKEEGKSVSSFIDQLPDWAKDTVQSCQHYRDIDKIDDKVFSLPTDQVKALNDAIPEGLYESFVKQMVSQKKWDESPIKLTSMLRLNGKPFTLSKHRFFEPMFYSDLPPRMLLVCARQVGKALALSTPIPTPTGTACIESLRVGDFVLGPDGEPTEVIATSDVIPDATAYKVCFNDGTSVSACEDHQWTVYQSVKRRGGNEKDYLEWREQTLTTKQLSDRGLRKPGGEYRFSLPQVHPVQLPEADLPIEPYAFGVWLGDGHSAGGRVSSSVEDSAISDRIKESYKVSGPNLIPSSSKATWFSIHGIRKHLVALSVFNNKHIPLAYLRSSLIQRQALLQGIMDTDGTVSKKGLCSVGFSNKRLADDTAQLLNSLGFIVKRRTKQPNYPGSKLHYLMSFTARADFPVFHLPRKFARQKTKEEARGKPRQTLHKKITSIEPVDSQPMCCIEVSNEDNLYLCGEGWIPTHNSTHMAAQGVLQAAALDRFKVLFLAPQFEQIRRFSHQYIKQFVQESFLKDMITDRTTMDSVLQKTFKNKSELFFSFALLSVERVRGLAVDAIRLDEIQDLQPDFLDIIRECMSASSRRSEMYTGTSKTVDNLIEQLRLQSSQAEWFMKCEACNHWNIPTVEGSGPGLGVGAMLGPEGLCCAKCKRLINPEKGVWIHKFPERVGFFPSYHIPQVVAPIHYANQKNWKSLLYKKEEMAPARFINEILGEACDEGQRLVSKTELETASCLNVNTLEEALKVRGRYTDVILGVDWGGKGERMQSFTAVAAMGLRPDSNRLEVFFAKVYPALMDPVEETKSVVGLFSALKGSGIAHDVAVAGEIRRSLMREIGLNEQNLFNCRYSPGMISKHFIEFKPASDVNPVSYYNIDRNRLLAAVCLSIKGKQLLFPDYESMGNEAGKNIMDHFLAIYEETTETAHGREQKFIKRNPGMPDDFLHACGFACATMWSRYEHTMPRLDEVFMDPMTSEEIDLIEPPRFDSNDFWAD
jgi:hypothetical protein